MVCVFRVEGRGLRVGRSRKAEEKSWCRSRGNRFSAFCFPPSTFRFPLAPILRDNALESTRIAKLTCGLRESTRDSRCVEYVSESFPPPSARRDPQPRGHPSLFNPQSRVRSLEFGVRRSEREIRREALRPLTSDLRPPPSAFRLPLSFLPSTRNNRFDRQSRQNRQAGMIRRVRCRGIPDGRTCCQSASRATGSDVCFREVSRVRESRIGDFGLRIGSQKIRHPHSAIPWLSTLRSRLSTLS
jgi:hypothetical protein